jgi:uncharacterized protein (UPF0332 family)
MDSRVRLYLDRAENEIIISRANFDISMSAELKTMLKIQPERTFFNDVISQCYYAIFYTAKAYLISRGIETAPPEEHKKTYEEFARFVNSGKIDRQLLEIYSLEKEKAAVLLDIFRSEKKKRGRFTYNVNANANIPFARESLERSRIFVSLLKAITESMAARQR